MVSTQTPFRRHSTNFRVVTNHSDISALIDLAREAHEESRFSYIPFSPEKVVRIAESAISDKKRQGIFLADMKGIPVGFSFCSIGEYHIGTGFLVATINNINVTKSVRSKMAGGRIALGLFAGIRTWAQARHANEIMFHVTSGIGITSTHKLALKIGYNLIGGSYATKL